METGILSLLLGVWIGEVFILTQKAQTHMAFDPQIHFEEFTLPMLLHLGNMMDMQTYFPKYYL